MTTTWLRVISHPIGPVYSHPAAPLGVAECRWTSAEPALFDLKYVRRYSVDGREEALRIVAGAAQFPGLDVNDEVAVYTREARQPMVADWQLPATRPTPGVILDTRVVEIRQAALESDMLH